MDQRPSHWVTIRTRRRSADLFLVFSAELDILRTTYSSLSAVFLGLAFGVLVAVVVSLLTTETIYRPYFVATAVASAVLSGFFLIRVVRDVRHADRLVDRITRSSQRAENSLLQADDRRT